MNLILGHLEDATNTRVLDAIRWEASPEYQRRISEASQVGVERVMDELGEYRPLWNEFETALVNKIGLTIARTNSFTNPLSEFKRGTLSFGDTIEEIEVGLLKAYNYDPKRDYGGEVLFSRELPEVQSNYHRLNRQDMYKVTVNRPLLQRAFLEDSGLSSYTAKLMEAPSKSDEWDEFLLMTKLFSIYEEKGGFFKVNIPDLTDFSSSKADAETALRKIRAMADTIPYISTRYNAAHMPVSANRDELILFTTPEVKSSIDVNALAAAFHIDRANVPNRIIPVPQEYFRMDGTQAILTTKDFFVVVDNDYAADSQWNPANRHMNHFLHHWQTISASRFVPAIEFTTLPGTDVIEVIPVIDSITAITTVDVNGSAVTTVEPGMVYQLTPTVTTTPADAADWWRMGVRLVLTGNTSARTSLSDSGVLQLSGLEQAETLVVTAIDLNNAETELSISLTVAGENTPVWPATGETP